jgi:hypothetical protein
MCFFRGGLLEVVRPIIMMFVEKIDVLLYHRIRGFGIVKPFMLYEAHSVIVCGTMALVYRVPSSNFGARFGGTGGKSRAGSRGIWRLTARGTSPIRFQYGVALTCCSEIK